MLSLLLLAVQDQDVPHRISTPSKEAMGRPRYSLVWKLVFFPKGTGPGPTYASAAGTAGGTTAGTASGTAAPTLPGLDGTTAAAADGQGKRGGGRARTPASRKPAPLLPPTLCRPEWGEPMRLGSARAVPGQPDAWRGSGSR